VNYNEATNQVSKNKSFLKTPHISKNELTSLTASNGDHLALACSRDVSRDASAGNETVRMTACVFRRGNGDVASVNDA
jgi:hypothetical protein